MLTNKVLYIAYFENILNRCIVDNNFNHHKLICFKIKIKTITNSNTIRERETVTHSNPVPETETKRISMYKTKKKKKNTKIRIRIKNKIIKIKIYINDNRKDMKISVNRNYVVYNKNRIISSLKPVDIDTINLTAEIHAIHSKKYLKTTEDYFKIITDKYPSINTNLTCGEYKLFIERLKKQVDKSRSVKENKIIKMNSNVSELETIRIIDKSSFNHVDVHVYENYLINKNNKHVGNIKYWIDEDGEIPCKFKTLDNRVLNPLSNLPIIEILVSESGSMFCNINKGIYREYEYIEDEEIFIKTNCIMI
tara:strand:+ start:5484 stop:6407 length:924 start_codon:yes stop_codon:yes gene_type:complete